MKRFNLSAWAVAHPALVLFLILALAVGGTLSFLRLGRGEDPSFTIKNVIVTAVWPGATAQEMQDQVADRIEKRLQELPYFDKVITYTKPGFTAMNVGFRDNTPAREVPQLFYQLRKKLTDLRSDLPRDLIGPNVNDEFGDVDSVLYMMTGDGADYAQLKTVAEALRQRLLKVPGVTKVNLYGIQDPKIYVEFSHAKLATLGIAPQAIFDSLQKQNAVAPAGVVETGAQRIPLRITGAFDGERAVAETPVEANGRVFRLGDIATVTRGFEDPSDFMIRSAAKGALRIGIVMAKGSNILAFGPRGEGGHDASWRACRRASPSSRLPDQPKVVDEAIWEFERSFVEALADRARGLVPEPGPALPAS
jgi:multidrug efflux pump subunit AcrB